MFWLLFLTPKTSNLLHTSLWPIKGAKWGERKEKRRGIDLRKGEIWLRLLSRFTMAAANRAWWKANSVGGKFECGDAEINIWGICKKFSGVVFLVYFPFLMFFFNWRFCVFCRNIVWWVFFVCLWFGIF